MNVKSAWSVVFRMETCKQRNELRLADVIETLFFPIVAALTYASRI